MTFALATPQRDATLAGAAAFEAGGNALDAALASAAVLTVTYPHNCGLGGDLFALVRTPDGATVNINASGPAPSLTNPERQRRQGESMPLTGPAPITVPGCVAGWKRIHELGAVGSWEDIFGAAIRCADAGVAVSRSLAAAITERGAEIEADEGMRAVFHPGGAPLSEGERLAQPALAETLRGLAAEGPTALYGGTLGTRLTTGLEAAGSLLRARDLAGFEPEVGAPLRGSFRDLDLLTSPPNSSGVLLLQALAALDASGDELDPLGADAAILAHIFGLGGGMRDELLADPRAAAVDADRWLAPERIAEVLEEAMAQASSGVAAPTGRVERRHGDTVAVVAIDGDGYGVSLIQSLLHGFGACVLEPRTGIVLQNRGASFKLEPGHPNVLAPGKRPAHTLMPVMLERDGKLVYVLGTMGGKVHAQIHVQVLLRLLDGLTPEAAVRAPRWIVGGSELSDPDDAIAIEEGLEEDAREALARAGLPIQVLPRLSETFGHAQAIAVEAQGGLAAGSDPRADGHALVS